MLYRNHERINFKPRLKSWKHWTAVSVDYLRSFTLWYMGLLPIEDNGRWSYNIMHWLKLSNNSDCCQLIDLVIKCTCEISSICSLFLLNIKIRMFIILKCMDCRSYCLIIAFYPRECF